MSADVMGTVAVVDLEAVCELYGLDTLPSPLGRSRPVGSVWLLSRDMGSIDDRLNGGDLGGARAWVEALVRADVCVDCRVSFSDVGARDLRVHGLLADETGFVAMQRNDRDGVDVVDIHAVSPYALGVAVTEAVGLVGAGTRLRIAVTGRGSQLPAPTESIEEYDDFGFLIPSAEPRDATLRIVDGQDVVAIATLKSWHDPGRRWDGDANRQTLQWVQVDDDGDYLYAPGAAGYAEPLDAELLRTCIEGLIAG